jgi:hypothetical protein
MKSFYEEDIKALDFNKKTNIFSSLTKPSDGFAVLVNLNLGDKKYSCVQTKDDLHRHIKLI